MQRRTLWAETKALNWEGTRATTVRGDRDVELASANLQKKRELTGSSWDWGAPHGRAQHPGRQNSGQIRMKLVNDLNGMEQSKAIFKDPRARVPRSKSIKYPKNGPFSPIFDPSLQKKKKTTTKNPSPSSRLKGGRINKSR